MLIKVLVYSWHIVMPSIEFSLFPCPENESSRFLGKIPTEWRMKKKPGLSVNGKTNFTSNARTKSKHLI